jgi:2-polyprenyl-6-methoxyphenol hydroxylase-like FAD-dependent oxidoreductase
MNVLISGASVAGPALAYWLGRCGHRSTVVETAPALRGGGYAVDFRGPTHLTVLERMGVLDEISRRQTGGSPMRFVDETGRQLMLLPGEFAGGAVEITRSDLSRVLYEHSLDTTEYVFGDSVAGLTETADGVDVTFERGAPRTFDLVIGADGIHSNVRKLVFGPEARFVRHLGYYVACWDVPNHLGVGAESLMYNVPGKLASMAGDRHDSAKASAFFIFQSEQLDYDRRDLDQQKKLIADAYQGVGWETPRLIESLWHSAELYFDSISRADLDPWSRGRISLVGDAACGATIGGMGTGTAIVSAYVLAGELHRAGGDHRIAFPRYENAIRSYAQGTQQGGDRTGLFLAPRTPFGIRARNRLLNNRLLLKAFLKMGEHVSSKLDLPDYGI